MPSEVVQLGQFVLDVSRYELSSGGKPVRMERIPMDLLILLVREKGRLVGREEIIERLWGKDVHFDTDNGINTAIRKIRRTLGEDAEKPQYIETVLGKGYRFKIPLELAISNGDKSSPPNPMFLSLQAESQTQHQPSLYSASGCPLPGISFYWD